MALPWQGVQSPPKSWASWRGGSRGRRRRGASAQAKSVAAWQPAPLQVA
ncbi:MAG: hypothetical protein R3F59_20345 [Myxococcota bacterium]